MTTCEINENVIELHFRNYSAITPEELNMNSTPQSFGGFEGFEGSGQKS